METTISARDRLSTARRVGRIFIIRLHGRSTLVIVSLVALVLAVALVTIRNGVTLGGITGSESTDDAYVRADQISISSHIAGYVQSIPVQDNETVRQGQLFPCSKRWAATGKRLRSPTWLPIVRQSAESKSPQEIVRPRG